MSACGETGHAGPPKNQEVNRGAVAFYPHAAPLGLGAGGDCAMAKGAGAPCGQGDAGTTGRGDGWLSKWT